MGSPKISRASEIDCGPAKLDFGWPDWPASEKLSMTHGWYVLCRLNEYLKQFFAEIAEGNDMFTRYN